MRRKSAHTAGSALVVTIAVVATLLVLLAVAVEYTSQISRNTQRTRKTAVAMEIADGHLEALFTNWRNIYRTTWTTTSNNSGGVDYSLCGGNFFFTASYSPGPAPTPIPYMSPAATPPPIPLPARTLFPSEPAYSVTQYRIQGVDPMVTLDANGTAQVEGGSKGTGGYVALSPAAIPPPAYGPNTWQYSFYYLASVDVTVPAATGNVTAKVRRVFEKKFDQPWTYAMFFVDDLELQPSTAFTVTGPIHTNASLYIGSNNFTTTSWVEYGSDYVNGYSPKDPRFPGAAFTAPNFAKSKSTLALSDCPPVQVSPYLPWGWNLSLGSASGNGNDDGYHEIIERPVAGDDPLKNVRYFYQPGYRIVISASGSPSVTYINSSGTVSTISGSTMNALVGNNGQGTSTTVVQQNKPFFDKRLDGFPANAAEADKTGAVKVTNIDISRLISNLGSLPGWTGLLYLADEGATIFNADGTVKTPGTPSTVTINGTNYTTTRRAFRLINGWAMTEKSPYNGLTIVSENPVYIQGNYNTSATSSASVPSNNGTFTDPDASGYTRKPAAVIADAITVLSGAWDDAKSNQAISTRIASNTTVNAALVSGHMASNGSRYSGGGENFIRLLEDWKDATFCYYGSLVQLYASNQAVGPWNGDGFVYKSPKTTRIYYDDFAFSTDSPPGNLQIAAYLQQQRWYQVY